MGDKTIKNLEDLLQQYNSSTKVINSQVIDTTVPGENYAGVMLRVNATLEINGKEVELNGVAKTPNFTVHQFFRDHIPAQYKKEISFYREIVPLLQQFYKEATGEELPDIFPELYAARFNLTGDPHIVDEYAVILLENLVEKGYRNIDRHVGFDLEDAKLILKDIAIFHAVPLALKLKKPEEFENKIKKQAQIQMIHKRPPETMKKDGPPHHQMWLDILEKSDDAKPYIGAVMKLSEGGFNPHESGKEPFGTIAHHDLWTNNTMQVVNNGKVLKNKLIDFQMLSYQSPTKDLIFFLFTSLKFHLLDEHFDELVKYYHQCFIEILQKCNCNIEQFDWNHFEAELKSQAPKELFHTIGLMAPIFAAKGKPLFDNRQAPVIKPEGITDLAKQRAAKMIYMFGKRNWLTL